MLLISIIIAPWHSGVSEGFPNRDGRCHPESGWKRFGKKPLCAVRKTSQHISQESPRPYMAAMRAVAAKIRESGENE
jgi:hypothetical protein